MAFLNPNLLAQGVMHGLDHAAVAPAAEVVPDVAVGREVMGEESPGTAGAGLVEDGVLDLTQGILARAPGPPASGFGPGFLDLLPLGVGQISRIRQAFHKMHLPIQATFFTHSQLDFIH